MEIKIEKKDFTDFLQKISSVVTDIYDLDSDLSGFQIAFIGIEENDESKNVIEIKKYLLELYKSADLKIADFGTVYYNADLIGFEQKIGKVFDLVSKFNIQLILLGDLSKINFNILSKLRKHNEDFNFLYLNSHLKNSFFEKYYEKFDSIFDDFYFLGFQNYMVNAQLIEKMNQKQYFCSRFSELTNDLSDFEPFFRWSHIIQLDMASIKFADSPASENVSPNGFSANEICRLAYMSGLSDKLNIFCLSGYSNKLDIANTSAKLSAQIIWHFIDAYLFKKSQKNINDDFKVFHVTVEKDNIKTELKFSLCRNTNRWWFSFLDNGKEIFIPCSNIDYESAKSNRFTKRISLYVSKKHNS